MWRATYQNRKKFQSCPTRVAMHNVAGELDGGMAVMEEVMDLRLDEITIYHDYVGVQAWVTR